MHTGRYVRGVKTVAQACYRRLITPRGALRGGEEEANYGLDLVGLLGGPVEVGDVAAMERAIAAELKKDQRVSGADVTITETEAGGDIAWTVAIQGYTAKGPFDLVLAVSGVTVELVGLSEVTS
jgi:hypothetical protein